MKKLNLATLSLGAAISFSLISSFAFAEGSDQAALGLTPEQEAAYIPSYNSYIAAKEQENAAIDKCNAEDPKKPSKFCSDRTKAFEAEVKDHKRMEETIRKNFVEECKKEGATAVFRFDYSYCQPLATSHALEAVNPVEPPCSQCEQLKKLQPKEATAWDYILAGASGNVHLIDVSGLIDRNKNYDLLAFKEAAWNNVKFVTPRDQPLVFENYGRFADLPSDNAASVAPAK